MEIKEVNLWERMLPNQPYYSDLFRGKGGVEKAIYDTILQTCGLEHPAKHFQIEETDMFSIDVMASNPVTLGILQWLISLTQPRRVLEIGAFVGVSTMYMAEAMPDDGKLTTIEKFDHFAEIACRNFANNGFEGKIELICGDAFEEIPRLDTSEPFDFVFLDGNKERYADHFKHAAPLVRSGGVVVVDDTFFNGDVFNDTQVSEKGQGVQAFLDHAASCRSWRRMMIPNANGMMVMLKEA